MTESKEEVLDELHIITDPTILPDDVVINSYITLLLKGRPNWIAFDSFKIEDLKRSLLPHGWLEIPNILIPVLVESHWSLFHVQLHEGKLGYYSSVLPSSEDAEAIDVSFGFFVFSLILD